jgi:hypothetical protein
MAFLTIMGFLNHFSMKGGPSPWKFQPSPYVAFRCFLHPKEEEWQGGFDSKGRLQPLRPLQSQKQAENNELLIHQN